jgi:hypothetical protein
MTASLPKRHLTVDGQNRDKPENYVKVPRRVLGRNPATA